MAPLSSLTMRPATAEDIPRLTDIYFAAFRGNTVQDIVFPDTSKEARDFWFNGLVEDLGDPYARIQVLEEQDGGRQIVAFAKWIAPKPPGAKSTPLPPRDKWPSDGDPDVALLVFGEMAAFHDRIMSDRTGQPVPHWYLDLIATDPKHQGRGAAGRLLRYGEAQADAAGVPCYLDATPEGRPAYTSPGHGFRVVESKKYFNGTYEQLCMVRDPRPVKAGL